MLQWTSLYKLSWVHVCLFQIKTGVELLTVIACTFSILTVSTKLPPKGAPPDGLPSSGWVRVTPKPLQHRCYQTWRFCAHLAGARRRLAAVWPWGCPAPSVVRKWPISPVTILLFPRVVFSFWCVCRSLSYTPGFACHLRERSGQACRSPLRPFEAWRRAGAFGAFVNRALSGSAVGVWGGCPDVKVMELSSCIFSWQLPFRRICFPVYAWVVVTCEASSCLGRAELSICLFPVGFLSLPGPVLLISVFLEKCPFHGGFWSQFSISWACLSSVPALFVSCFLSPWCFLAEGLSILSVVSKHQPWVLFYFLVCFLCPCSHVISSPLIFFGFILLAFCVCFFWFQTWTVWVTYF